MKWKCIICKRKVSHYDKNDKPTKELRSWRFGDYENFGRICDECLLTKSNPCPKTKSNISIGVKE